MSGEQEELRRSLTRTIVVRGAFLLIAAVALNGVGPRLVDVFGSAPRLGEVRWWWFPVLGLLEGASFASAWALARAAVPELSWFVASTAQLASNASSRVFPGGAVFGGALYYRMLAAAGIEPGHAGTALAANSLISAMALFALPAIAAVAAAATAPVPEGLLPVAVGGAAVFVVLFVVAFLAARYDRPLRLAAGMADAVLGRLGDRLGKDWHVDPEAILRRRDQVVDALGDRWGSATAAAAANWLFDYMTLVAALYAVGARPRLSLVLLAYSVSAVLTMIPITPGGLGFVEAGLTATLTLAGVASGTALVATLAYRLFSLWLPIPVGAVAYVVFRRRIGRPEPANA